MSESRASSEFGPIECAALLAYVAGLFFSGWAFRQNVGEAILFALVVGNLFVFAALLFILSPRYILHANKIKSLYLCGDETVIIQAEVIECRSGTFCHSGEVTLKYPVAENRWVKRTVPSMETFSTRDTEQVRVIRAYPKSGMIERDLKGNDKERRFDLTRSIILVLIGVAELTCYLLFVRGKESTWSAVLSIVLMIPFAFTTWTSLLNKKHENLLTGGCLINDNGEREYEECREIDMGSWVNEDGEREYEQAVEIDMDALKHPEPEAFASSVGIEQPIPTSSAEIA